MNQLVTGDREYPANPWKRAKARGWKALRRARRKIARASRRANR